MLSKLFKFLWAIIAPLPGRLWPLSGSRFGQSLQFVDFANPLYSHSLNQYTGKSLMRGIKRLSVFIIALFIALFLTILTPLQAATYDWSSLGGNDSGEAGFKDVGSSAPLIVPNKFTNSGTDMYKDGSVSQDTYAIKANSSTCSFDVQEMSFKWFCPTSVLGYINITFKDSSDNSLIALTKSNFDFSPCDVATTLADIYVSFSGVTGVSSIEFDAKSNNNALENLTFKSIDLDNITSAPCAPVTSPEPTNHPTSFTATANTSSKITTTWTDSTGTQLPAGYLVMCNTSDSFTAPVDKTAQTDDTDCSGGGVQNIAQGTQSAEWTSLNSGTQYYFKVYPYTNSGANIDFKIDGSPLTANATTLKNVIYVSSTGNDSTGDGSSGNPYLTLTKGILQVADGGTVNVAAGTYTETTMITIEKNVTINGNSSTSTIIDGNNHHPLFKIDFGKTVVMNYLTVSNGLADDTVNGILQTDGGGILNNAGGTLTLNNCTVSGNVAKSGGGGIDNAGGTLTLNNSTVSGNNAQASDGGGIRGGATLNNSTITNNTAAGSGDGIAGGGTLNNSLVVGNTTEEVDSFGTYTNNNSYVGTGSTVTWLGTLADNGGPTQTHALLTGAPNTVVSAGSSCLTTDQRGINRATACDVGAYEAGKISLAAGTTPTEAGTVGTFTMTLTPKLPADDSLTINYSTTGGTATISDDYDINGTGTNYNITFNTNSFTIDGLAYNLGLPPDDPSLNDPSFEVASITLDIPAQNDAIDDDAETVKITLTSANNGYIIAPGSDNATLTITDDDTKSITVNPISGLVTTESAGTATFTVKLNSQPTADVTIGLSSDNTNEGTIDLSSLTFKPTGTPLWSDPQTVTITGVNDTPPAIDGDIGYNIVTAAATGGDYAGIDPSDVSVTNNDNETPGVTVNPTTLTVSEPTGNGTFTIKLNTQPSGSADVTISSIAASNGECSISPTSTTIANANWNTGTTFTVTAQNDDVIDGNQTCTIQIGTSTSSDGDYNNIDPTDVTVTVQDDDSQPAPTPAPSPPSTMTLTVEYAGNGEGKITSEPAGIDCHNDNAPCEQTFDSGTNVTLTPVANGDSEFVNFSGDSDCQKDRIFITSDVTCTVYFKYTGVGIKGKQANCPETTLVYVNPDATEDSGCSWDSPFTDLQTVLTAIAEGSLPKQKFGSMPALINRRLGQTVKRRSNSSMACQFTVDFLAMKRI